MKRKVLGSLVVMGFVSVMLTAGYALAVDNYGKNIDPKWMKENRWDKWGSDDQVGALNMLTSRSVLDALRLVKKGKVYDLETVRFKGMPVWPGHSGWDLLPYASPKGRQNMVKESMYSAKYNFYAKGGWLDEDINKYNVGLNSEIMMGPLHVGTHMDSLSHLTVGKDNHWWGGAKECDCWSDFGPLKCDASHIPPMIMRGILLDIPGYKNVRHLAPHEPVSIDDVKECARWEGVEIKKGDCVLINTGQNWPEMNTAPAAGPTLEAIMYLIGEKDVAIIGDDQAAFEWFPSDAPASFPGHVHPCHQYMLIQNGVHIMEMVQMDELAKDKVYEFCFICLPTKIKGATGMMIRPIAVI